MAVLWAYWAEFQETSEFCWRASHSRAFAVAFLVAASMRTFSAAGAGVAISKHRPATRKEKARQPFREGGDTSFSPLPEGEGLGGRGEGSTIPELFSVTVESCPLT